MSKTSSVKTDFVLPIAVLTLICLVCAALLGYFNSLTGPIIAETVAAEEARARQEVLPEADSFTELDLDLPDTFEDGTKNYVTRVYAADNGAGYVFMVTGRSRSISVIHSGMVTFLLIPLYFFKTPFSVKKSYIDALRFLN